MQYHPLLYTIVTLLLSSRSILAWNDDAIQMFRGLQGTHPDIHDTSSQPQSKPHLQKRASRFLNNATQKFVVNGTGLPDVPFDIGESYAGLLPISSAANETRQLYFWFFPTTNPAAGDQITFWFNGGPGCSSLIGLLEENGPFLWIPGTYAPTPNPYKWNNLTNMVWVEQPIGTGFTQGKSNITNEVQLAQQFLGFYRNFADTFQTRNWTTYLTGESYAGMYVPYIADAFLSANDSTYFKLGGINIIDPSIGSSYLQQRVFAVPFANKWSQILDINNTYLTQLNQDQDYCNYTAYIQKYFTFPPPSGPIPFPVNTSQSLPRRCETYFNVATAATALNPCFNVYHILDTCPAPYDPLGSQSGAGKPRGAPIYFNRTDVQRAINAPLGTIWRECSNSVASFGGSAAGTDQSFPPTTNGVLQRVIEATGNVFVGGGGLDYIIQTNGTIMSIQNMTWNGVQGFTQYPLRQGLYVPYHREYNVNRLSGAGIMGQWSKERNLTFYSVSLAGHRKFFFRCGFRSRLAY